MRKQNQYYQAFAMKQLKVDWVILTDQIRAAQYFQTIAWRDTQLLK